MTDGSAQTVPTSTWLRMGGEKFAGEQVYIHFLIGQSPGKEPTMAKIIIAGDALVIKSSAKLETLKKVGKYRPKKLTLTDENGKETFVVGTTSGKGSINTFGASFGSSAKDGSGLATITLDIPAGTADVRKYAEDYVGAAVLNLSKVEAQIESAETEIESELSAVRDTIEVL